MFIQNNGFNISLPSDNVTFYVEGEEILKLCPEGEIYVRGKLAHNDKQVVEALKQFLNKQGLYPL